MMRSNPYLLQSLKYATLSIAALILVIIGLALTKQGGMSLLTGRLVSPQDSGVIPTVHFSADKAIEGFLAPPNTHVFFVIPQGRIPRVTFMGGSALDAVIRSWGYCPDGKEAQNKAAGKRGKDLYTGKFFYSLAERKAQLLRPKAADNDLLGVIEDAKEPEKEPLASIQEIFYGGTCYVTIDEVTAKEAGFEGGIPMGIDADGDDMNSGIEKKFGTNPESPDTDRDGLADGIEVYVAKTNPLEPDTDHDELPDGCEDADRDGIMDKGETSPNSADSDNDGLCDGTGEGAGCIEDRQDVCSQDEDKQHVCHSRAVQPAGEDMNLNCKFETGKETDPRDPTTYGDTPDFDYKLNAYISTFGIRPTGQGVDAPEFPIPGLPVDITDPVR